MKGFSNIRWFSREEVCNELAMNYAVLPNFVEQLLNDEIGEALPKRMHEILLTSADKLQAELACNLDMKPILTACYSLEGDGLGILLARRKLDSLLLWGENLGNSPESMPNVAALLRSRLKLQSGVKVYELFSDLNPPQWFEGVVVEPRCAGKITVKYTDNTKIDQDEHEVRQWIDVRELDEWKRLAAAAKGGITYLRNRLTGNLPANQKNFDCSHMFSVLRAVQVFDPSWAASNLNSDSIDFLSLVVPLRDKIEGLKREQYAYLTAAASVTIDHTESKEDHSFTEQVLKFFEEHGSEFPAWAEAARIIFAFTPNSAAAERVFSLLNQLFGKQQLAALGDYIQSALMLHYNEREVG